MLFPFADGSGPIAFANQNRAERAVPELDLRFEANHRFKSRLRGLQIVAIEGGYAGAILTVGLLAVRSDGC